MGRPIGSLNRQKPFADALRVALLSGGGRRLRIIADRLAEKAEQGDLGVHPADRGCPLLGEQRKTYALIELFRF
jgi:hypothetical protein